MGGGDEKVAGADCGVADFEFQESIHGGLALLPAHSLSHDRLQGRVKQALHERIRCVVAPRCFAFVAGRSVQLKGAAVGIEDRVKFEQSFVDAAELFGAEILIVDRPANGSVLHEGEGVDRREEVAIGH